jgi:hypothetical protein
MSLPVIAGRGLFPPAPIVIVFGPDGAMLKVMTAPPAAAFAALIAARSVHDVGVHEPPLSSVDVTTRTAAALAESTNSIAGSTCSTTTTAARRATFAVMNRLIGMPLRTALRFGRQPALAPIRERRFERVPGGQERPNTPDKVAHPPSRKCRVVTPATTIYMSNMSYVPPNVGPTPFVVIQLSRPISIRRSAAGTTVRLCDVG